jgi:LysR family glycine cleavage system transcriptional activator
MRDRLPPLDLLRGFEAAARHLSFTKAASELYVTQSAVSRQIHSLEQHLGVDLFRRRPRALLLTDEGQALYRAVTEAFAHLREATGKLGSSRQKAIVNVTTLVSFASLWLIPRLATFRAKHPEIDVRLSASNEVLDLDRERFDLAIRYCHPDSAPPGAIKLFGEEVFPVCSPGFLKATTLNKPGDVARCVLLHYQEDVGDTRPWLSWSTWFEAMKLVDIEPAGTLRFNQYDHLIQAAIDGQGLALGRYPLMKQYLENGSLVAPFEGRSQASRAYFLIEARKKVRGAEYLVDWLLKETNVS